MPGGDGYLAFQLQLRLNRLDTFGGVNQENQRSPEISRDAH